MVFNFELFGQHQFNYGQVYVALSRVKALSDLYLTGDINEKSIRADKKVQTEYQRLQELENFNHSSVNVISESTSHNVFISLLNIRSFKNILQMSDLILNWLNLT